MDRETVYDIVSIGIFWILYGVCGSLVFAWGLQTFLTLRWFDIMVLSIATFRLTHLISYDKVLGFVRKWFMVRHGSEYLEPKRGIRKFIYGLLGCLWCTGMWSALIVLTMYCSNIWGRFSVEILAVAGAASLLQLTSFLFARASK